MMLLKIGINPYANIFQINNLFMYPIHSNYAGSKQ